MSLDQNSQDILTYLMHKSQQAQQSQQVNNLLAQVNERPQLLQHPLVYQVVLQLVKQRHLLSENNINVVLLQQILLKAGLTNQHVKTAFQNISSATSSPETITPPINGQQYSPGLQQQTHLNQSTPFSQESPMKPHQYSSPFVTSSTGTPQPKKLTLDQVKRVHLIIEECLGRNMNKSEAILTTAARVAAEGIGMSVVELVWNKLEEQNPEFFKNYHIKLLLMQQPDMSLPQGSSTGNNVTSQFVGNNILSQGSPSNVVPPLPLHTSPIVDQGYNMCSSPRGAGSSNNSCGGRRMSMDFGTLEHHQHPAFPSNFNPGRRMSIPGEFALGGVRPGFDTMNVQMQLLQLQQQYMNRQTSLQPQTQTSFSNNQSSSFSENTNYANMPHVQRRNSVDASMFQPLVYPQQVQPEPTIQYQQSTELCSPQLHAQTGQSHDDVMFDSLSSPRTLNAWNEDLFSPSALFSDVGAPDFK